jgi:hypothetical protein
MAGLKWERREIKLVHSYSFLKIKQSFNDYIFFHSPNLPHIYATKKIIATKANNLTTNSAVLLLNHLAIMTTLLGWYC